MTGLLLSAGFPAWVQGIVILGFVSVFTLVAVYAERKISAFIQDRLGPMETGPWGSLQTLADILKLTFKEPIRPDAAHRFWYWLAPVLVFTAVYAGFATLPFGAGGAAASVNIGVVWLLGIVALDVVGILMAGWGSMNKYAVLGAARAVAQVIAYEIPVGLALMSGLLMVGSLNLEVVAQAQGTYAASPVYFLGEWDVTNIGGLTGWLAFRYPHLLVAWVVYFIASLAECNRAPFDLAEAESELISGYHTEYGGVGFALFFLSEYGKMLLVSVLGVTVFLGGWNTPLPNLGPVALADWTSGAPGTWAGILWGGGWLLLKSLLVVGLQMWIRWTYPRLRVDQLMRLCWKWLTPIGLGLFAVSAVWKVAEVMA